MWVNCIRRHGTIRADRNDVFDWATGLVGPEIPTSSTSTQEGFYTVTVTARTRPAQLDLYIAGRSKEGTRKHERILRSSVLYAGRHGSPHAGFSLSVHRPSDVRAGRMRTHDS